MQNSRKDTKIQILDRSWKKKKNTKRTRLVRKEKLNRL